jgi:hypothetical protein
METNQEMNSDDEMPPLESALDDESELLFDRWMSYEQDDDVPELVSYEDEWWIKERN